MTDEPAKPEQPRKKKRVGKYRTFVPTPEQRFIVARLAGSRMTWDELCQLITWPGTEKTISKETLGRAFAPELAAGRARLKEIIINQWLDCMQNEKGMAHWSAVEFALRHIMGYRDDTPMVNIGLDGQPRISSIALEFVERKPRPDDDPEDFAPRRLPPPPPGGGERGRQPPDYHAHEAPRERRDYPRSPPTIDLEPNPPNSGVPIMPRKRHWMED